MPGDNHRVVHMFDKGVKKFPYQIDGNVAEFQGRAPLELYQGKVDYDGIDVHYGEEVTSINADFREKVVNLTNPEVLADYRGQDLMLNWITSRDITAARVGVIPQDSFNQLAAITIPVTSDNMVIMGVRSSKYNPAEGKRDKLVQIVGHGYYGFPGGSVSVRDEYHTDPISDTSKYELSQELGRHIRTGSVQPLGIIEATSKPGPTGYKFVSLVRLKSRAEDVLRENAQATVLYEKILSEGGSDEDVRSALEELELPIDGWEHYPLFAVPNHPGPLRNLLRFNDQSFIGISSGPIELYADWLENVLDNASEYLVDFSECSKNLSENKPHYNVRGLSRTVDEFREVLSKHDLNLVDYRSVSNLDDWESTTARFRAFIDGELDEKAFEEMKDNFFSIKIIDK